MTSTSTPATTHHRGRSFRFGIAGVPMGTPGGGAAERGGVHVAPGAAVGVVPSQAQLGPGGRDGGAVAGAPGDGAAGGGATGVVAAAGAAANGETAGVGAGAG